MRINKKQEQILRKEFSKLQSRVKKQNRDNEIFAKTKCRNLLKALKIRWDYVLCQLFETEAYGDIESILHDLRND